MEARSVVRGVRWAKVPGIWWGPGNKRGPTEEASGHRECGPAAFSCRPPPAWATARGPSRLPFPAWPSASPPAVREGPENLE